eukprot:2225197-Rhodomonas_salina.1
MRVQLDAIQSLFGLEGKDSVFSSLCTDTAIEDVNTWFGSVAEHFRETHLLSFLRSCTDMADAQILVNSVISLRVRYALSGSDVAHGDPRMRLTFSTVDRADILCSLSFIFSSHCSARGKKDK